MSTSDNNNDNNSNKEPVILLAAVEGGGTSFRVAVCQVIENSNSIVPKILHQTQIDSSHENPHQTLQECCDFLRQHKPSSGYYHALGLATFGPVGLHETTGSGENDDEYGTILKSTPKAAWRGFDVLGPLRQACCQEEEGTTTSSSRKLLPVKVDTDVNAPALAEYKQHLQNNNNKLSSLAYVTVGTGVGVGLIVNGLPVHGRMHPEGGHVPVQPLANDNFTGYSWGKDCCPFQGINTVEGLACSVSLTERLQQMNNDGNKNLSRSVLADLPSDHEVWDHAANALASLCATLLLMLSIEKIVLGGGILQRKGLLENIQTRTVTLLNGYLDLPTNNMAELITTSSFGADAGLVGACVLAQEAYNNNMKESSVLLDEEVGRKEDKERETKMKQEAFGVGLWQGFLVGAVATGLFFKYVYRGGQHHRR